MKQGSCGPPVLVEEEEKKEDETATLTFPDGKKYPI